MIHLSNWPVTLRWFCHVCRAILCDREQVNLVEPKLKCRSLYIVIFVQVKLLTNHDDINFTNDFQQAMLMRRVFSLCALPVVCAQNTVSNVVAEANQVPIHASSAKVSVIIPCRYETEYIAKTLFYLLQDSTPELLHEIILVDDASEVRTSVVVARQFRIGGLLASVSNDFRSKIKVLRWDERQGLIRAKIRGADFASG